MKRFDEQFLLKIKKVSLKKEELDNINPNEYVPNDGLPSY